MLLIGWYQFILEVSRFALMFIDFKIILILSYQAPTTYNPKDKAVFQILLCSSVEKFFLVYYWVKTITLFEFQSLLLIVFLTKLYKQIQ